MYTLENICYDNLYDVIYDIDVKDVINDNKLKTTLDNIRMLASTYIKSGRPKNYQDIYIRISNDLMYILFFLIRIEDNPNILDNYDKIKDNLKNYINEVETTLVLFVSV